MENPKHIFVVGGQTPENAFLGRKKELSDLNELIIQARHSAAISLVGPTRIGKSSLVRQLLKQYPPDENCITLFISSVSSFESAHHFWRTIWTELRKQMMARDLWDTFMEEDYNSFAPLPPDGNWYTLMHENLPNLLMDMKDSGYTMLLIMDEFDGITKLFGDKIHFYQELRDLLSVEEMGVRGIAISRRTIRELETDSQSISTLHGIFKMINVRAFRPEEMEEYYEALGEYGLTVSERGRDAITEITGCNPYLLEMLAQELTIHKPESQFCGQQEIYRAYSEIAPSVQMYFDDLINRMRADGHWGAVLDLCLGSEEILADKHLKQRMIAMGYLREVRSGDNFRYVAYSDEFMQYMISLPLDDAPLWNTLMGAERLLKRLVGIVYPMLNSTTISNSGVTNRAQTEVDTESDYVMAPIWSTVLINGAKNSMRAGSPRPICEALTMDNLVHMIKDHWKRFKGYFQDNTVWIDRLNTIVNVRNPLGHALGHYLTREEIRIAEKNSLDLIALLNKQI